MSYKYSLLLIIVIIILLIISVLYADQIVKPTGVYINQIRNSEGTLTFTVRTVTYNGSYAPHNVGAIWITNSNNQFVKTIKVWAQEERSALIRWLTSSGNNTTGAITGATLNSHQLHNVTWNGTNVSNAQVIDGNYNVNVEFAEHGASSSNMGKYTVHNFPKGPDGVDQNIPNETYFQNLHLVWDPVPVSIDDELNPASSILLYQNYPNPFNNRTTIKYELYNNAMVTLKIFNSKGQLIRTLINQNKSPGTYSVDWNRKDSNGKILPAGIYYSRLQSAGEIRTINLVIK